MAGREGEGGAGGPGWLNPPQVANSGGPRALTRRLPAKRDSARESSTAPTAKWTYSSTVFARGFPILVFENPPSDWAPFAGRHPRPHAQGGLVAGTSIAVTSDKRLLRATDDELRTPR